MAPHTYFRFASTTKNFTATAILKMHQDGWLNYTDRIVNPIPGSAVPYVPSTPAWNIPYKDRITIRQLLQHNAGVYDVDNAPVPGCEGLSYVGYKLAQDPDHQFSSPELVEQVAIHNLSFFTPGSVNYHYSDTGYTILSEINARVIHGDRGMDIASEEYRDQIRNWMASSLSLGGHSGWRLPSLDELLGLYHSPCKSLMEVVSDAYWSSTTYENNWSLAWRVHFDRGPAYKASKSLFCRFRAVRSAQ